jgi:hypothetical protein
MLLNTPQYMRFEALTAVYMMNTVVCDMKPCSLVEIYHCFVVTYCPNFHGSRLGKQVPKIC